MEKKIRPEANTELPLFNDQRFQLAKGYHLKGGPEGEGFLIYPEGIIHLNQSAFAILQRIDEGATREGILAALQQGFDIVELNADKGFEAMQKDLDTFLQQALADHWIEELP